MSTALRAVAVTLFVVLTGFAGAALAQDAERFNVRLSTAPIELANAAAVKGGGSASAVLDGRELTIEGEFSGLVGAATAARLHIGKVMGMRGPAVAELDIEPASSGSVTGAVRLTREQVDALAAGRMYLQIDSDAAPDGNLWGWLLP